MDNEYVVRSIQVSTGARYYVQWAVSRVIVANDLPSAHAARSYMVREYPEAREQAAMFVVAPPLPYASGSETSKAAAVSMADHAGTIRDRIYAYLLERPEGATRQQIYKAFGSSMQTVGPRVLELIAAGIAYEDGTKRQTESKRAAFVVFARAEGDTRPIPRRPESKGERLTRLGDELARLCTLYIGLPESTAAVAEWRKAVGDETRSDA